MVEETKNPPSPEAMEDKAVDPEKSAGADNGARVPEKFKKLVGEIEKLSVLDLAELVKVLEKKFGVSPTPIFGMGAPVAPVGATSAASEAEEKSIFNVELKEVGTQKIEVIKIVRDVTGKGLKEAKDIVDAVATGPQMVKENAKKEEAEDLKKKLETVGAKVELK